MFLDNASYHKAKESVYPTSASKKEDFVNWLKVHILEHPDVTTDSLIFQQLVEWNGLGLKKAVLVELVSEITQQNDIYQKTKCQKIAENFDIKLCYTPPYSPELNPIELIWGSMKRTLSEEYTGDKSIQNLIDRITRIASEVATEELWIRCFSHVQKFETRYWESEENDENINESDGNDDLEEIEDQESADDDNWNEEDE